MARSPTTFARKLKAASPWRRATRNSPVASTASAMGRAVRRAAASPTGDPEHREWVTGTASGSPVCGTRFSYNPGDNVTNRQDLSGRDRNPRPTH